MVGGGKEEEEDKGQMHTRPIASSNFNLFATIIACKLFESYGNILENNHTSKEQRCTNKNKAVQTKINKKTKLYKQRSIKKQNCKK